MSVGAKSLEIRGVSRAGRRPTGTAIAFGIGVAGIALALVACGARSADDAWERAATALQSGDLATAESFAKEAAAVDPAHAALLDFVRGSAAFARSEKAQADAARPGAEPTLLDRAIADAEDALSAWRKAATSRDDWPEARRNVERAILRLERLRKQKAGTPPAGTPPSPPIPLPGTQSPSPRQPDVPPPPPPPPTPSGTGGREDPSAEVTTTELPAADVMRVLDVLTAKEREKQAMRRRERESRRGASADVERDW